MAEPYIGEIRIFPFNWAPQGYLPCDGQTLLQAQYPALYAIIGNTYGTTPTPNAFVLPDLRGRAAMHWANKGVPAPVPPGTNTAYSIGTSGGAEGITLTGSQLASHTHNLTVYKNPGSIDQPGPTVLPGVDKAPGSFELYGPLPASQASQVPMAQASLGPVGSGVPQPHSNLQPCLALQFCIAWEGAFPINPN